VTLIHADQDDDIDIVHRQMPVNADGQATGATIVTHASGLHELWAYYASCCCCTTREPFFSPADRDAWAEVHRADHPTHAMQLTTEPWDFRTPPWVAADGLPLTPPRSLITMTSAPPPDPFKDFPPGFPRPDWDDDTLLRVMERRTQLRDGCPKHYGNANTQLTFYKELFVNDPDTGTHAPTMAVYADGCMVNWRIDVKDEEPRYEQAPQGSY